MWKGRKSWLLNCPSNYFFFMMKGLNARRNINIFWKFYESVAWIKIFGLSFCGFGWIFLGSDVICLTYRLVGYSAKWSTLT